MGEKEVYGHDKKVKLVFKPIIKFFYITFAHKICHNCEITSFLLTINLDS